MNQFLIPDKDILFSFTIISLNDTLNELLINSLPSLLKINKNIFLSRKEKHIIIRILNYLKNRNDK